MLRAYKLRLYPNAEQRVLLEKHFGCVRWIYNWGLAERLKGYECKGKDISFHELCAALPKLKSAEETQWLSEINAQSLQSALRNLDIAFTRFFRKKSRFPKFKCKAGRQSFQCPQRCLVDFEKRTLTIPKVFQIKFRDSRTFSGAIKTVTVSKTGTGKYYASVLTEVAGEDPVAETKIRDSEVIGVDIGLKHFASLSTGEKIENPHHLKKAFRKLRRAQRALCRKKKGSNNRNKCISRVAIIHETVANRRRDFHHKLSTRLIRENQAVALETLNVVGLLQNRGVSRAINDVAWGQFLSMLEYKAKRYGKIVLRIGMFAPSSKLCSCGVLNDKLRIDERTWKCEACGAIHDRDILAANNIKRMALNPANFLGQGMTKFTPVEIGQCQSLKQECST